MLRFILNTVLTALVFAYVFPMIGGAHFTGGFWPEGLLYGLLLAVVAQLFAVALTIVGFATFGLGFVLALLGFWLIPGIELQILAYYFPHNLAFDGWGSAIIAGLVLSVFQSITAWLTHSSRSSD